MSVIALIQGLRPPVVNDYEVCLDGLPAEMDGTVLVAMADCHLGSLIGQKWIEARVRQIEALKPDIIVLLGDIFEGHGRPAAGVLNALRSLSAPLGVWAVHGNHEGYGRGGAGTSPFAGAGIPVLRNRCVEIRPGFVLAGVDNFSRSGGPQQADEVASEVLAGRPPGATVFLSHTPWGAEAAAKAGVGLMLSGHTHGGQIWPFGYFELHVYPLMAGRYDVNGMTVLVTRGAGTWGPRMRLWAPGEILRVTLRSKLPAGRPVSASAGGTASPPPSG
jgi:predicted MPP superfamily phosphohydrolase